MLNSISIKVLTEIFSVLLIGLGPFYSALAQESQVTQFLDKQRSDYIQGMHKETPAMITQYHAENIRLMPEANPTILGKKHAQQFFLAWFNRFDISSYQRVKTDIIDMGNRVAELGKFELEMHNSAGARRTLRGKYVNLWSNQDNELKLLTEVWNFDFWPEFKSELIFDQIPSTITALEAHLPINTPVLFELAAYSALSDITIPMRDGNVLAQFYTDNAKIMANFRPAIEGKEAIQQYWQKHAQDLASFEILQGRTDKIETAGRYVIAYGSHIAGWRSGQESGVSTGKHFRIWHREPHGGLRTRVLISAYDK